MHFLALATDYDGTLATEGHVFSGVLERLRWLSCSGVKLILVTGRVLSELGTVFPEFEIFDQVVLENGAVLYCPKNKELRRLTSVASRSLFVELESAGVEPLSRGECVVATLSSQLLRVTQALERLPAEYQVIFNRDSLMILPKGVDKLFGLGEALKELRLSISQLVSVGDAENDVGFIRRSGFRATVANAIAELKEIAEYVSPSEGSEGVAELIDHLAKNRLLPLKSNSRPVQAVTR